MQIIKKIQIKQIVTEASKDKLQTRFENQKMSLEKECEQLKFEQRKQENKYQTSKQEIMQRFQREIKRRRETIDQIDFKLQQLSIVELGSEITEKEVRALVDVDIGSSWDEVMGSSAIIFKDDVVIRIDH